MIRRYPAQSLLFGFLALLAAYAMVAPTLTIGVRAHPPGAPNQTLPGQPQASRTSSIAEQNVGWTAHAESLFAGAWTQIGSAGDVAVQALALHPASPGRILAGTYLEGLFLTTNSGSSWSNPLGASVATLAHNPQHPHVVYAGTWREGVFKSTDAGVSWSAINSGLAANDVYALAVDPVTASTIYAGTEMGFFKSVNGGASWQGASAGFTGRNVYVLTISNNSLLAGTDHGVFRSNNSAGSWVSSSTGLQASQVLALWAEGQTAYAGTELGVFRSQDGGVSWTDASNGLPAGKVPAVIGVAGSPSIAFAGTRLGVYASLDGGIGWAPLNEGLSERALQVYALALDASESPNHLYAGTGDGVWQRSAQVEPTPTPTITPTPSPGEIYLPLLLRRFPRPTATPTPIGGWQTVLSTGFEGPFPGQWQLYGEPTWGRTDCRAYAGSHSVWPAATGEGAVTPCSDDYPNNLYAWLYYGPIDLSDATAAQLNFKLWQRTESGYDYFKYMVSLDDVYYYGLRSSGASDGWVDVSMDLTDLPTLGNVCGESEVWIAFIMESDLSYTDVGPFVDQVVLRIKTGAQQASSQSASEWTKLTTNDFHIEAASARKP